MGVSWSQRGTSLKFQDQELNELTSYEDQEMGGEESYVELET